MTAGSRARSVAVLLGGPSAEHDVSIVSGRAIARALGDRGHAVAGWLIDLDGGWWSLPAEAMDPAIEQGRYDEPARLGADGPLEVAEALARLRRLDPPPVVFIALHGPFGEDGTVQALCESAGLTYTGSGVAASAVGMDKVIFKRLIGSLGLPGVPWHAVAAADLRTDRVRVLSELRAFAKGLPAQGMPERRLIVKPAALGSSVGICIVHRPDAGGELEAALDEAFLHGDTAIAEAYLPGPRELEVSVVGNRASDVAVYGPGEIFPGHEFYDYTAKYAAGVSTTTNRPELEPALRARIRELARDVYLAVGASGFARVDFLVSRGRPFVSEINTIPGFTPISLFPVLCAEGGYDFGAIAEHIVDLAIDRAAHRPYRRLTRADLP